MNLNQLRYVKAVAETASFTQAAELCYVTQPTLSNGIAQLEQELEQRLFARTTRTVLLTPFGEHMLPFIEQVLVAQDTLLHEARNFGQPSKAVVRIGTSPLLRADWLVPMLETFRKAYPDIDIILHEQNMAELYRMLDDRLLDVVLGVGESPKISWNRTFLYREPLYYIPSGDNHPEQGGTIRFEEIAKETFVMVPNACGLARATRALFRSHRHKLHEYSGEAMSYQVLEEWASLGLGAAILPKSKLHTSKFRPYLLTDKQSKEITLDFEAVWINGLQQPVHLQQFVEFLGKYKSIYR